MEQDAAGRRAERAEQAAHHVEDQRLRAAQESEAARLFLDRFLERAGQDGLATEEQTARPWSGRGRYRTGVTGWYLRRDRSIGVGVDGGYYVLVVPPERFGRWRGITLSPTPPPLQVGRRRSGRAHREDLRHRA